MNLSLLLFSVAALVPAFVFVGLGAIPALSLISVFGAVAMLMRDYSAETSYQRALAAQRHQHHLPLAA